MKHSHKRIMYWGVFFLSISVFAGASFAETPKKAVTTEKTDVQQIPADKVKIIKNFRKARRFILCVDGHKVFQTVGPTWGTGASPSVSSVQLFEEKDGKSVPARCEKGSNIVIKQQE